MIAHVVMIKVKDEDKDKLPELKAKMTALPPIIDEIRAYEVGINEIESARAYDASLYSTFESYEALKTYNDHPEHQKVLGFIRSIAAHVAAVDYTLD